MIYQIYQSLFSGKIRKNVTSLSSTETTHRYVFYFNFPFFQNLRSSETFLSDDENESDDEVFNKLRLRKSGRQEMSKLLSKHRVKIDNFETEFAESDI